MTSKKQLNIYGDQCNELNFVARDNILAQGVFRRKKKIKERKETKNPYKTTPQTFEKKTKSQSPCHCNLSKHVVGGIRKKFPEEGFFLFSSCSTSTPEPYHHSCIPKPELSPQIYFVCNSVQRTFLTFSLKLFFPNLRKKLNSFKSKIVPSSLKLSCYEHTWSLAHGITEEEISK